VKIGFSQSIYLDSITTVSKRTYTYKKVKKERLRLDFYRPKKVEKETPVIIYVHGGGFSGGKRNEDYIKKFSFHMAERGYAVASISYQLIMKQLGFGCDTPSEEKINAFNTASEDISFAIKYLLEKKEKLNIDENKIILIGSSAGAEAVLNLAYIYKNNILPEKFKFAGLISMAGAVISAEKITEETAIPTQLFHGTDDQLVPYDISPHHYCKPENKGFLMLYGSKAIANRLNELDKPYYIYTIKNGDHSWSSRPMVDCTSDMLDFLYYDVLENKKRQIDITM